MHPLFLSILRPIRLHFLAIAGCYLISSTALIIQAYGLSWLVNSLFLDGVVLDELDHPLILFAFATVIRVAALIVGSQLSELVSAWVKVDLRNQLFAHLKNNPYESHHKLTPGEVGNTILEGVEAIHIYVRYYVPQLFMAILIPLSILVLVFHFDLISGIVLLVTAPLIPFFMSLIGNLANRKNKAQWTQLSRMSAAFLDIIQGMPTIKLFGRSHDFAKRISEISQRYRIITLRVLRIAFLSALTLELLATISTALVSVQIGLRLLYGFLSFQAAFFVLILTPEFYQPLRQMGSRFHDAMKGITALERINELLSQNNESIIPSQREELASTPCLLTKTHPPSIAFDTVGYTYPHRSGFVLNNISLTLHPGSWHIIVGESGVGKTTLTRLLLKLIEPTSGSISINGVALQAIRARDWHQHVGWVSQFPQIFEGSLVHNICMNTTNVTKNELNQLAIEWNLMDFVQTLPNGWDTQVGESGYNLSGGQQQQLAWMRMLVRKPTLFILDEATSNLDVFLEQHLENKLGSLQGAITIFQITHRNTFSNKAHGIHVLKEGCIISEKDST